jgi:hypothetical protein
MPGITDVETSLILEIETPSHEWQVDRSGRAPGLQGIDRALPLVEIRPRVRRHVDGRSPTWRA